MTPAVASGRVIFRQEPLTETFIGEISPLLRDHWREIAHYPDIPLEPDYGVYRALAEAGMLRIYTVREPAAMLDVTTGQEADYGVARLTGYAVFILRRAPHYKSSLEATQDILYLAPALRGRTIGAQFIRWCDGRLRGDGVQVVIHHVKRAHNFGPMLERMGYEATDLLYRKRLDREG